MRTFIHRRFFVALAALSSTAVLAACDTVADARPASPVNDSVRTATAFPLIPATAGIERVTDLVRDPARDSIIGDPRVAAAVI